MPFNYDEKHPGDVLQSSDWNAAMQEVTRLEKDKLNRDGAETLKGSLSIREALAVSGSVTVGGRLEVVGELRVTGAIAGNILVKDTRDINDPPNAFDRAIYFDFKKRSTIGVPGSGDFSGTMTIAPWTDNSGDAHHQLNFNEGGIFWRQGQPDATSWDEWRRIPHDRMSSGFSFMGNLGVGIIDPGQALVVNSTFATSRQTGSGMSNGGAIAIRSNAPQIDFIDTDNNDWSIHVNSNKMYFIREPWQYQDLVLDGAGGVGIGTDSPQAKLHIIHVPQDANGTALIVGPTNVPHLRLGYHSSYAWIQSHASGPLSLNPLGNNLGIGTTNPTHRFHVVAPDAVGLFESSGSQAYLRISANDGIDNRVEITNRGGGRLSLWTAGGGDVLNILRGGNVGIGTTTPNDRLDVAGNLRILTGSNPIRFTSSWTSFTDPATNQAEISNDTGSYKTLMIVGNKSNDGSTRRVSIWDRLEVNGTIYENGQSLGDRYLSKEFSEKLRSNNWQYNLILQDDRNLVLYAPNLAVWSTRTNVSDVRLKDQIRPIDRALEKVLSLQGISFYWKDQTMGSDREIGVIAQQVETTFPELMINIDERQKLVQYEKFAPILIEAIREQQEMISQLQSEVQSLKSKI